MDHESCNDRINQALDLAKSGETEQGLLQLDTVIQDCAARTEPWMEEVRASALYNKATVLRFDSKADDAVHVFDEIISGFEDATNAVAGRYRCMAFYNKGVTLQNAGRYDPAIEAYAAMIDRFQSSSDSFERQRVAQSSLGKAQCYELLDREADVQRELEDLVSRFGDAPEPEIQALIGPVLLHTPELLCSLPAAAHAFRSEFNGAMEDSIRLEAADEPDVMEAYLKTHRALIAKDVARAAERHGQAVAMLKDHFRNETPFALFLRNFDIEASEENLSIGSDTGVSISLTTSEYSDVENAVSAALAGRLPAIGISNPASFRPDVIHRIAKLELRNELWQYALVALVRRASLIVVKLEHLSPGVALELEAVRQCGRQASTVVILPDSKPSSNGDDREAGLDQLKDFPTVISDSELQSPEITSRLQTL